MNTQTSYSGFFWDGLALLFIGLKLTDQIDWSWFWVLAPIWVAFIFGFAAALIKKNLGSD